MASNKEIVKVLKVETKGSDVSVKSLRQEISALRDVLLNTEKGTEEYNQAVQQIKTNQDLLAQAMNATKTEAEALDGSYNALTQKLNELKQAWKATNDEVERSKLTEEINEVKNALTDLDTSIGNYQTNVGNYANSFKEAMSDAQEQIEPMKAKFESVQKVAAGVASGFAAVQGAVALMGVENEKLEETFIKLQAAMAIAQGIGGLGDLIEGVSQAKVAFSGAIKAVKTFVVSLRGMKLAIASTGIGLLVVALGMLVEYFMTTKETAKEAAKESDKLANSLGRLEKWLSGRALGRNTAELNAYARALKNASGNAEELEKIMKEYGKTSAENQIKYATEALEEYKKTAEQASKAFSDYLKYTKYSAIPSRREQYDPEEEDRLRKLAEDAENKVKEQENRLAQLKVDLETSRAQITIDEANAAKERTETNVQSVKDTEEAYKQMFKNIRSEMAKDGGILPTTSDDYAKLQIDEAFKEIDDEKQVALRTFEAYWEKRKKIDKKGYEDAKKEFNDYYEWLKGKSELGIWKNITDERETEIEEAISDFYDGMDSAFQESDEKRDYSLFSAQQNNPEQHTSKYFLGFEVDTTMSDELQNLETKKNLLLEIQKIEKDTYEEKKQYLDEIINDENVETEVKEQAIKEKTKLDNKYAIQAKELEQKITEITDDEEKKKKKIRMLALKAHLGYAADIAGSLSSILGEETKAGKIAATAQATIDTYKAANAAYAAMSGILFVGPALGIAAAAAAIASGIANVKKIWEVKENQENSPSSSPSSAAAQSIVRPNINLADSLPTQLVQNVMTDSELSELNNPTKVYVTETDIKDTMNKVEVTESNASF